MSLNTPTPIPAGTVKVFDDIMPLDEDEDGDEEEEALAAKKCAVRKRRS